MIGKCVNKIEMKGEISVRKRILVLFKRVLLLFLMIITGGVLGCFADTLGNILTIEAEDGTLNGVSIIKDDSVSGGAYVDGFDAEDKNLVLTAELPADAVYQVLVRYKTYSGDKTNYIYLNNIKVADYVFNDTAEWKETIIGQFKLKKGKNTLKIASFWGWIGVDYVQFIGGSSEPVKKVEFEIDRDINIGLDSSLVLTARADNAAEYHFFVREKGGEWDKLGDYSEKPSCIWLPPSIGEFEFRVWARKVGSDVEKEAEKAIKVSVLAPYINKPLLNPIYTDNMVLQRDIPVAIAGWSEPGDIITVDIANIITKTSTDENGEWFLEIGPFSKGGPYEMTISSSTETISISNILFGEVWLCSGQSNMAFQVTNTLNAAEEIRNSDHPEIRFINIPQNTAYRPAGIIEGNMEWSISLPSTISSTTAVGYFFARKLNEELDVPVGIINASIGGSAIETWISYDNLKKIPKYINSANAIRNAEVDIETTQSPTVLFNGMISPLLSYKIKGVLWYQGEENWGQSVYYKLLQTFIKDWRNKFGITDLPFIIDQISSFNDQRPVQSAANPVERYKGLPEIREAQLITVLNDENCGLVVTTDIGDPSDIHPPNKQDVGLRSALSAFAIVYGQEIVSSGPVYKSMKIEKDKIRIFFDHTGSGLVVGKKEGLEPVKIDKKGKLTGFAIAGNDGKFYYADAVIDGDTVLVSADGVENPAIVRFGWHNAPVTNLYNKEGLPASPFRTDYVYTL